MAPPPSPPLFKEAVLFMTDKEYGSVEVALSADKRDVAEHGFQNTLPGYFINREGLAGQGQGISGLKTS